MAGISLPNIAEASVEILGFSQDDSRNSSVYLGKFGKCSLLIPLLQKLFFLNIVWRKEYQNLNNNNNTNFPNFMLYYKIICKSSIHRNYKGDYSERIVSRDGVTTVFPGGGQASWY